MGLRRHRQIVVWSSSPGRPGALGFTRASRAARIRLCFRTSGLLAVIGLLRVAAAVRPRWRPLAVGTALTVAGYVMRNGMPGVVMIPGMLFLTAALLAPGDPAEASPETGDTQTETQD